MLNSAVGLGMVLGSVLSVALVGQPVAAAFSGAIALQGIGLAGPALVPLVLPTIAFFVASGAGKAILEVAGNLLQRTVPTRGARSSPSSSRSSPRSRPGR